MIRLVVNGREAEMEGPVGLLAYLAGLGVDWRAVAVEVNGAILDRSAFASTTLGEGDQVEVVRMVGGGRR